MAGDNNRERLKMVNSQLLILKMFKTKYVVPTFVFPTLFLFGRKVVSEGFVFWSVTTFGAALEIIFQPLGQIGKPI